MAAQFGVLSHHKFAIEVLTCLIWLKMATFSKNKQWHRSNIKNWTERIMVKTNGSYIPNAISTEPLFYLTTIICYVLPCMWVVGWMGYINTINELSGSGDQQLSYSTLTLYSQYVHLPASMLRGQTVKNLLNCSGSADKSAVTKLAGKSPSPRWL